MNKLITIALEILLVLVVLAFAFACWNLERHLNWKFYYGSRVEQRIQQLEKRVDALEKGSHAENDISGIHR